MASRERGEPVCCDDEWEEYGEGGNGASDCVDGCGS